MNMRGRGGIEPIRNFWTYRWILRTASKYNPVVRLSFSTDGGKELAFGDDYLPFTWSRTISEDQHRFYRRIDYADEGGLYAVLDHANRDTGVRIAWGRGDLGIVGNTSDRILAINLKLKQLYSPPRNLEYSWKNPGFAAIYATNDLEGWRDWNEADSGIVQGREAKCS